MVYKIITGLYLLRVVQVAMVYCNAKSTNTLVGKEVKYAKTSINWQKLSLPVSEKTSPKRWCGQVLDFVYREQCQPLDLAPRSSVLLHSTVAIHCCFPSK